MLKKTLIILFVIFSILCASQISFASSMANDVKNTINSGTNTVVDGVQNLTRDVRNGIAGAENGIEDALTMNTNNTMVDNSVSVTRNTLDTTNYNAARTADMLTGTTSADNTTMWVWLIVAIAAIVIVALVWFYGSQNHID